LVAVAVALVLFVTPVWLTFVWSTWHDSQIFSFPPHLLPGPYLLANLKLLEGSADIWRAVLNSVVVGVASSGGAVLFATCAGYAFAKFRFRGQNAIFYLFLGAYAIPGQITAIPLFIVMSRLGWIDTYQAVILPAMVPAMALFFMRSTISQIVPTEMLEAARLDGAGEFRIVRSMVFPTVLPNAASLGILGFSLSWSNLFWPLVVLRSNEMATVPVALVGLIGTYTQPYGELMAGAAVGTIVPMLLFIPLRKYFVRGVVISGAR
jgi:lactose/L-arabinose transport system permease protein